MEKGGGELFISGLEHTCILHFSSSNWRTEDKKREEDVSKERDEKGEEVGMISMESRGKKKIIGGGCKQRKR
jgi:hypothetical protein